MLYWICVDSTDIDMLEPFLKVGANVNAIFKKHFLNCSSVDIRFIQQNLVVLSCLTESHGLEMK